MHRAILISIFTIFIAYGPCSPSSRADIADAAGVNINIKQYIIRIKNTNIHDNYSGPVNNLYNYLLLVNKGDISQNSINDIASLMDSPYESVRYWAARCLSIIGNRARGAIPILRKRLTEDDCIIGDKTSGEAIKLALADIGANPPFPTCDMKKYGRKYDREFEKELFK